MRTTINISDDLMSKLKKKAFDTGKPLTEIINNTIRAGIKALGRPGQKYKCPDFSLGEPSHYDLDKALKISESIEDEEIIRKIQLNK